MSMPQGMALRMSLLRDPSVTGEKLPRGTTRRVLSYAKPMTSLIVVLVFLLVVGSGLVVLQPLLAQRLIDEGVTPSNRDVVVSSALLIALAALADAALSIWTRWVSSRIGEGLIYSLRTEVFDHVLTMSMGFFTRTQTGALVSRVNSDVIGAQRAFTSTLTGVLGNAIRVVAVVATMLSLSWQLTVVALLLVPVFLLPARFVGRRLQALTSEQMNLNAEMQSTMTEKFNVSGALLVKLFGRENSEREIFSTKASRVRDIGIKIAMSNNFLFTSLMLIASIASAVVYGLGGIAVIETDLSVGSLLAMIALLSQIYGPLTALSNVRVDVMTALVSFLRVFELLDVKPAVEDPALPKVLTDQPLSVEFADVVFRYPAADTVGVASLESLSRSDLVPQDEPILSGISFAIEPGGMLAIVGPSGAGKSTIAHLIPRLYDVESGAVRIGGVDVRELSRASITDHIGVVTQDSHLFHDTIRANLLYAKSDATEKQMWQALEGAQLRPLVESLKDGLETVVGDRGHRLSGGEKQRLAIARVLLKSPRILILDEATAHLDSESEALVTQALDVALQGRTAVVIAHRLSTVRQANKIVVLEQGRVVQLGTHEELLSQGGLYKELYERQFNEAS